MTGSLRDKYCTNLWSLKGFRIHVLILSFWHPFWFPVFDFLCWCMLSSHASLTLSTLDEIFSRRHSEIFLIFPENRILYYMQIDTICMSKLIQFAWSIKYCFLGRIRKNISVCRLLKILPECQALNKIYTCTMYYWHNCWWTSVKKR